jgi:class 3 adenylate cyclase
VKRPEPRYVTSGGLCVAFQAVGEGPRDLVLVDQWFSHMDGMWDVPPLARLVERLASFSRVITFDERGIGESDPLPMRSLPTLEEWMDDQRAVMDALGVQRAALVAGLGAGFMATVFAATNPERVSALVLVNCFARFGRAIDYPLGAAPAEQAQRTNEFRAGWGKGIMLKQFAPTMAGDAGLLEVWSRYERAAASPGIARAMLDMLYASDVRAVLPSIRMPTLVIASGDATRIPAAHSRYIADHIPDAEYVELPGPDLMMWAGDQEATVAEIEEFLTGARGLSEIDRVLATLMFTDIVGSTDLAARIGDRAWRGLLDRHHRAIRAELARFRGREVTTAGDGFLAVFDGPGRAVRCARAAIESVKALDLEIRVGLHTGEVELTEDDIQGIAVHVGARIASLAGPGEVLVSSTVKDLVAGSGIEFEDRGERMLKGVPDPWRVLAVTRA